LLKKFCWGRKRGKASTARGGEELKQKLKARAIKEAGVPPQRAKRVREKRVSTKTKFNTA